MQKGKDTKVWVRGRLLYKHLCWKWSVSWLSECMCAQSCPPFCDPMVYSQPDSSVHRIFQARKLKWAAICHFLFQGSSWPRDQTHPLILRLLHWQVISLPLHHVGSPMALDNDCIRSCIPIGKFSKYNIRVISDSCIHLYLFLSQASSFQLMATQLPKPRSHHWLFSSF